ncbi:MAG TPA: Ni/Fe-hydrogenase cytochrome b subunit [Anaeromyxobacter sp.]|nr:Ni/Fe-hydrogenase cytochrome b subunit [Anaeromyxobacter sp.]
MSAHDHPQAIGGKVLDPLMTTLLAIFAVAAAVMVYRFFAGIGPVSNMTDGFTWGIWEPVNVVVFTGIGAGAYGVGLLCYLLNKGKYHGLVRPAVLVGAISYTLGASSIVVALGRYWNAYWLPWVPYWNLGSALLEVAVCVLSYVLVLWVEVLPSVFDGAAASASPSWAAWGKKWGARLAAAMPFIIALAILLPTMHQSSLGGLMLIAGPKIHPLWHTGLLPTLFLISCLSMGYGAVVVLVNILNLTWNAKQDDKLFADMSKVNAGLLFLYVALRLVNIVLNGKLRFFQADFPTFLFLFEMALFLAPAFMFLTVKGSGQRGKLFGAALLAIAAGAFYRVDTYLTMYRPVGWTAEGKPFSAGWDYFPSLGETIVTVGMAAVGIAVFIFISRKFPVVVVGDRAHSNLSGGQTAAGR